MYRVSFVPGPGLDDDSMCVCEISSSYPYDSSTQAEVLEFLRARHKVEGWNSDGDLMYEQYRRHHEWGLLQLRSFEDYGMPIAMPVRHGAYVVSMDIS